jgi:pimeloyl-ACP methyl ester carboxylesterase
VGRTVIFVHGGFHGGWCWRRVAGPLSLLGWQVFTPTLTGLGERAHLATPELGLETHIQDLVNLFECEELTDVLLCGHSNAGVVISAVAERIPGRIDHLMYIDALVPRSGDSVLSVIGDEQGMPELCRQQARDLGDGWLVPASTLEAGYFGVTDPGDVAWVERRLTGQPLKVIEDTVSLGAGFASIRKKTFYRCGQARASSTTRLMRELSQDPDWETAQWDCGHDVMVTAPHLVIDAVVRAGNDIRPLTAARAQAPWWPARVRVTGTGFLSMSRTGQCSSTASASSR